MQYVFVHDALEEYITCGDTSVLVANMKIAIRKGGFTQQFKVITDSMVTRVCQLGFIDCSFLTRSPTNLLHRVAMKDRPSTTSQRIGIPTRCHVCLIHIAQIIGCMISTISFSEYDTGSLKTNRG